MMKYTAAPAEMKVLTFSGVVSNLIETQKTLFIACHHIKWSNSYLEMVQ